MNNRLMILGFKKQFEQPILEGIKIHTIREDSNDRWHAGREIQMATGVRTKNYNQFKSGICNSTQTITIAYYLDYKPIVLVDGNMLYKKEIEKLARNDGFKSINEFFEFFDKDFKGKIIHWTPFKYLTS